MTSDREKCGLSSIFPMTCRERTEAFARRLHSRLSSLNSEEINSLASETTWIAHHDNPVTLSQPKHASEINVRTEFYLDPGILESPSSPTEEESNRKYENFDNEQSYVSGDDNRGDDSDSSDGPFYDTQCDLIHNNAESINSTENSITKGNQKNDLINLDSQLVDTDISPLKFNSNFLFMLNEKYVNESDRSNTTIETKQLETKTACHFGESDDSDGNIPRVRRCSSLKTGKTPPGTPGQKKIVRFADVLGLDLADVRTFLDEIPKIPNSAFSDLKEIDVKTSIDSSESMTLKVNEGLSDKILTPLFQQPGGQTNFIDRIRENQVCLDNAVVEEPSSFLIKGIVKVRNLDFHKSVHVRYTLDSWFTFADVPAEYIENSCDGFSDKFSFVLYANKLAIGEKLEFAIRFQCKGSQYWDNNYGNNYSFQCLPTRSVFVPNNSSTASFY